jgi:hypothetical protein
MNVRKASHTATARTFENAKLRMLGSAQKTCGAIATPIVNAYIF